MRSERQMALSRKRLFDLFLSGCLLFGLSPLFLVLAVIVWFDVGRPLLFSQERPGLEGKPFRLLKFRTMADDGDDLMSRSDQERLSRIGAALRSTSLDELPELWNVFVGDMSLVGPRPLLMEYLPLYSAAQARRHEVRPGITGWAQVNGRNRLPWPERFEHDVWYVDNQSFWLDMKILLRTIGRVLTRSDINESDDTTMTRFTGNPQ